MTARFVIHPARALAGVTRVPGDKSISHRALLLTCLGSGRCEIIGLLPSADVISTARALEQLGASLQSPKGVHEGKDEHAGWFDWQVLADGRIWSDLRPPEGTLDCGNSGTTARLLMGIAAGIRGSSRFDGDASLRLRPMERVAEPLRAMGARIQTTDGRLPILVEGGELQGIDVELEIASAQVKSAILLAGLGAHGVTRVREPLPTRDHTERMLRAFGAQVGMSDHAYTIRSSSLQNPSSIKVPGDMSSAAFLLAAAAIRPGSSLSIEGVGLNPTRTAFLDVLRRFGAAVESNETGIEAGEPRGTVSVRAGNRRPVTIEPVEVPSLIDELPLVAVLGAYAEGETTVAGAGELRVKESDRIEAMASGLRALGVEIETRPDGFVVRGGRPLSGGAVDSFGDHRIAMALAVAALGADEPVAVSGWDAVGVSYPGFERDLAALVAEGE